MANHLVAEPVGLVRHRWHLMLAVQNEDGTCGLLVDADDVAKYVGHLDLVAHATSCREIVASKSITRSRVILRKFSIIPLFDL
jgi:hypothetical protein